MSAVCLATGCVTSSLDSVRLKSSSAAIVTVGNETSRELKAGEEIETQKGMPILFESPGYASVLVVPLSPDAASIDVTMRPLERWSDESFHKREGATVSDILEQIEAVQRLLAKKQIDRAVAAVDSLRQAYPHIAYLDFLHASCLVVAGQQARAMAVLSQGLERFPNNKSARQLYDQLSGKKSTPPGETQETHDARDAQDAQDAH